MMLKMRKIHKYGGLALSVIVIITAITGILLIHKKALGLNKITVSVPGYTSPQSIDAWDILATQEGLVVVATKQGVFVHEEREWRMPLHSPTKKLYMKDGVIYSCSKDGLYASKDGKRWDKLFSGQEVMAVQKSKDGLLIAAAEGIYKKRPEEDKWEIAASFFQKPLEIRDLMSNEKGILLSAKEGIFTAEGSVLKKEQLPVIKKEGRIELKKLITDIHTGEFFGSYFYLLMDASAVGLIVLSITGIYLWWWPKRNRRR